MVLYLKYFMACPYKNSLCWDDPSTNQVELVLSVNFDAGMSPTRIHRLQKWIFSFHLSDKKQCITLHPLLLMSHTCVCVWVNLTRTFNGIFRSSVFNFQRHQNTWDDIFLTLSWVRKETLNNLCAHMKQQLMSLKFYCITITCQYSGSFSF